MTRGASPSYAEIACRRVSLDVIVAAYKLSLRDDPELLAKLSSDFGRHLRYMHKLYGYKERFSEQPISITARISLMQAVAQSCTVMHSHAQSCTVFPPHCTYRAKLHRVQAECALVWPQLSIYPPASSKKGFTSGAQSRFKTFLHSWQQCKTVFGTERALLQLAGPDKNVIRKTRR